MNKTLWIVVAVIVVLGGAYLLTSSPKVPPATEEQNTLSGEGRVIYSVTDAAADMGAISEINMTVSKVEMHSAASADAWVTVSSTPKTFDLLELNASSENEVLADVKTAVGTYDQVRLSVDSIIVKMKDGSTKTAKLPSGVLKINTAVLVRAEETASVNFDFLADKSLHVTGNGTYIFAPVVKTEVKSGATVNVAANGVVTINGGKVDNSSQMGMDVDGSVKLNFQIDASKKLDIGSDNKIKVGL